MQGTTPRSGNPAVREGLVFGLILGIIALIVNLLNNFVSLGSVNTILGYVVYLVGILFFILAGARASGQTGRTGTGAVAGLLTGLIGSLINAIVTLIVVIANVGTIVQQAQAAASSDQTRALITPGLIIGGVAIGLVILVALALGLGALFGLIGGLIGRGRAPQPMQPPMQPPM